MNKQHLFLIIFIVITVGYGLFIASAIPQEIQNVITIGDLVRLFPNKPAFIEQQAKSYIRTAKKQIKKILDIDDAERTFTNTAKALDNLERLSDLSILSQLLEVIELLSPVKAMRDAAHDASIKISQALIDMFSDKKLYQAFKAYVEGNAKNEDLNHEQRYFLEQAMIGFKRGGLELDDEMLERVKEVKKELTSLTLDFDKNIAEDNRTIELTKQELDGLPDDFIAALKLTSHGTYIVGIDYPSYFPVMQQATKSDTRKKMYHASNNRGYPANEELLKKIIAKRDELAQLLGYQSFAHYELAEQMVKSPERAQAFLDDLIKRADLKEEQEFQVLLKDLPEGVILTEDGKMQPWDFAFVQDRFKKRNFDIDEEKISEYFPVEETIKGLLSIYESFLSLRFEEAQIYGLWANDVRCLKVFEKDSGQLIGYLLLDLYPRANKYSHAAHATILASTYDKDNRPNTAISVIMANFPKGRGNKPPLFKRDDVKTFFHEFGHAMHALLGRTHLASFAGTAVKRDFVELPSQMLEEWMWDRDILKLISSHYETGQEMPDDLIDRILAMKHIATGAFVQRQGALSLLALDYFLEGANKDVRQIAQDVQSTIAKNIAYAPDTNFYASFGHLSGYGSKYYGYLWSRVFALDLFYEIKKHGLLDPVIGKRYIDKVIGRGGSDDPDNLLRDFLGREPNSDAFFKDMGL